MKLNPDDMSGLDMFIAVYCVFLTILTLLLIAAKLGA